MNNKSAWGWLALLMVSLVLLGVGQVQETGKTEQKKEQARLEEIEADKGDMTSEEYAKKRVEENTQNAIERAEKVQAERHEKVLKSYTPSNSAPRFDEFHAWAAVDAYGKVEYPYGFSLDKNSDISEVEGVWYVAGYADVTNSSGANRKATVTAAVKPKGDAFEMLIFAVQ